MNWVDFTLRMAVALLLGAAIGLERQWRQRIAGLRTNTLVCVGACIFVTVGMSTPHEGSPTRIAAQVVSGIGFLGAGIIMRNGLNVSGLNTAATLWCAAAIGVLCGAGHLNLAFIGAAGVLAANVLLRPLARKIIHETQNSADVETIYRVRAICRGKHEQHIRTLISQSVHQGPMRLRGLRSAESEVPERVELTAEMISEGRDDLALEQLVPRLSLEQSVSATSWEIVGENELQ